MNNYLYQKREFKKILRPAKINYFNFFLFRKRNFGQCLNCGSFENFYFNLKLRADFNTSILPIHIRKKFDYRKFGFCLNCGLAQGFNSLSKAELLEYLKIISDKDQTVSEEVYHSWPIPQEFVDKQNFNIFFKRSRRIIECLFEANLVPRVSLFLRPTFGYLYDSINKAFTIEASALEISSRAQKYCNEKFPDLKFIDGNVHGFLKLNCESKFDSIFCFHTLTHSIQFESDLKYLKSILKRGGFIVFSQEVLSKPYNPFHTVFTSDNIFEDILKNHFHNVIKIDDCEEHGVNIVCEMVTDNNTACDFVAFNPKS